MAADPTVTAAFEVVAERSGSAPAGLTPDRQWPFVFNQDRMSWALLPCCFGPWKTVYDYFRRRSWQGVWPRVLDQLTQRERRLHGRVSQPSAGIVDSQTIKTATHGKTAGYDAGKKIQGRKRHLVVDTSGLLQEVVVTAADVDDRDGLKQVLTRYSTPDVPRLRNLWVDGDYQGEAIRTWVAQLKKTHKIDLEVVAKQTTVMAWRASHQFRTL